MMRRKGRRTWPAVAILVLALLLALAACAPGSDVQATPTIPTDAPILSDFWARPGPAGANSAVYLTIQNPTDREVRLVGASTDAAQAAELHETVQDANGVLRMEPRPEGFAVAPGETVTLRPGGKHIMLLNLSRELAVGDTLTLTLTLEDDRGQVSTELTVPVQEGPGMEMGGTDHGNMAMEDEAMGQEEMAGPVLHADALESRLSDNGLFRVTVRSQVDPVTINQIHAWTIYVETADGQPVTDAQIQVSGGMPAHQHGFPTTPQVTQNLGNGDYLLEGMKFNMGGVWTLTLEIASGEGTDAVTFEFELK